MALLGGVEYLRGNIENALRVFDDIDLQAIIERLKPSLLEVFTKKNRPQGESDPIQNSANLMLEALYFKSLSHAKLAKPTGMYVLFLHSHFLHLNPSSNF